MSRRKPVQAKQGDENFDNLAKEINKKFGEGIIRTGRAIPNKIYYPTGVFLIDYALLGGIPESALTMLIGNPSGGKTTMAMKCVASAQRKYPQKKVLYLDIEGTYDPIWGELNGIDNDALYVANPETAEDMSDIAAATVRLEEVSMLVVDSLAALLPSDEADLSAADSVVALRARLVSRMLTKLKNFLITERRKGHNITIICINQYRTEIGKMHGDPRTLPGGVSQLFYADAVIDMRNKEVMSDSSQTSNYDYNIHSFTKKKYKFGNSIKTGEFKLIRNPDNPRGQAFIDDANTLLSFGKSWGLVGGAGQNQTIDGVDSKFRSGDMMQEYLYDNPEEYQKLKVKIVGKQRSKMGLPELPPDSYL